MANKKTTLTMLLLVSITLAGSNLPSVSSSPRHRPAKNAGQNDKEKKKNGKERASGADAKREAGRSALRRGEAGEALIYLEEALNLYTQDDKSGLAATHDLLGELYEQQGRFDLALKNFQTAYGVYTEPKSKDKYNANLMLAKLGNMYYRLSSFKEARDFYNRMNVEKPDSKLKKLESLAGGLLAGQRSDNRGISLGSSTGGGAMSARELFNLYRETILYAGHEIGLGRIDYQTGDAKSLELAKKHFEEARSVTKSSIPGLRNLGQMRRFRMAATTGLGDVELKQGDYAKALKNYEDAFKDSTKEKRKDLIWPALRGQGRSLWLQAKDEKDAITKEKYWDEGLKAYDAALKNIEDLRAGSIRADEARTTFLATTKDVFDEASSALAEKALKSAPADADKPLEGISLNYAKQAFEIVERGRARSLLDLLGESGTSITQGVPPDLLKKKQENLDRQAEIAQLILGVSLSDKQSQSIEALDNEAEKLQVEEVRIENEIRLNSQQRYRDLTSPQPLTLATVQQKVLDGETALLEYSLGREVSYLWVVTKESVRIYALPPRDKLDAQVNELRRTILQRGAARSILEPRPEDKRGLEEVDRKDEVFPPSAFISASHTLYESILKPAMAVVGARRLLIVPDGELSFVPFEALVTSPGGADYASLPYLAKTNETVYAPSASVIDAVRQQQASRNSSLKEEILLIADPIFNLADDRAMSLRGSPPAATATPGLFLTSAVSDVTGMEGKLRPAFSFKRLKGTSVEAERIAETSGASGLEVKKWLDLNASEANIDGDLQGYSIVHIATHGFVVENHPQYSGVVLSLVGNKDGQDGFLRTNEIFNLRLGSPLVMLSACKTGLGKVKSGEGVMGLTRAFMYAGAPLVGVSLWSVDDMSTADLMSDFYSRSLGKQRVKPVTALHSARLKMIASVKYSEPYYWAPFVLVGNWR